jgi:pleiotropic regulator 1
MTLGTLGNVAVVDSVVEINALAAQSLFSSVASASGTTLEDHKVRLQVKARALYPPPIPSIPLNKRQQGDDKETPSKRPLLLASSSSSGSTSARATGALIRQQETTKESPLAFFPTDKEEEEESSALIRIREPRRVPPPDWHAPWKLMRVISGHLGWVRCVAVDTSNEWFATGAGDRLIKVVPLDCCCSTAHPWQIWDLATGTLKLSLTGHINTVRGLAVSPRHPYLFSAGEDKMVKCWDLETNKVIRHYHGHLSGVFCLDVHPTLDVLVTGGRDSCARVPGFKINILHIYIYSHT